MNVSMTVSNIIIILTLRVNKTPLLGGKKKPHWRKEFKQNFKINFMAGSAH